MDYNSFSLWRQDVINAAIGREFLSGKQSNSPAVSLPKSGQSGHSNTPKICRYCRQQFVGSSETCGRSLCEGKARQEAMDNDAETP